jgi:hypothetical protein
LIKKKYIEKLKSTIKSLSDINIPDYLNNLDKLTVYLRYQGKKQFYLIIIKLIDSNIKNIEENITREEKNIEKSFNKYVYNLKTGICVYECIDLIKNSDLFIRETKDISLIVQENKVIEIKRRIKFEELKYEKFQIKSSYKGMSNPNFGVLDVETSKDEKGISHIYALGFVTLLEKNKINIFYLTDYISSLDSNLLVILCIDSLLISKYHNYNFYIHNMGNFDVIYLYKILKEFNLHKKEEYYILKTSFRDDVMLKLSISIKVNKKKYIKINLIDSLNILNNNLKSLGKAFNVETKKGLFPYNFVKKENLKYIGSVPDFKFYDNIIWSTEERNENYKFYINLNNIYKNNDWDLRKETIIYLECDLLCLLEVLEKFNSSLFINHNIQMTECLTISRIALSKYLKYYLKDHKLPLINKLQHFNFINYGYYGGITEVYKPFGTNLKYYDVNSLYPFASLNSMPGINCVYIENINGDGLNLSELFGFFHAEVKTNNNLYLGLLPIKTNLGLILPNGEFEGIWSSEELKLAQKYGYEIKVIKGYNFNKVENVFTKYVAEVYELKSNTEGVEKVINKSLLNNLLGRFGMNIIKAITKNVKKDEFDYILSTREVKSFHEITKNDFLVTFLPLIDEQICLEHGLDYIKVLNKDNNVNIEKNVDVYHDVSIVISAMVLSYARIFMNRIKLQILEMGGKIYYSDTDSLVTNIDLNNINSNLIGKGIGQFKLEYLIKEGYFISNKTYCLVKYDGKVIIKTKGIYNTSLTLEDFKKMYNQSENVIGIKSHNTKNYEKGFVKITEKQVKINFDSFKKREKIYNKDNLWIDTKPLVYNNIVKDIVLYSGTI